MEHEHDHIDGSHSSHDSKRAANHILTEQRDNEIDSSLKDFGEINNKPRGEMLF